MNDEKLLKKDMSYFILYFIYVTLLLTFIFIDE